jgi:hypothetical protein
MSQATPEAQDTGKFRQNTKDQFYTTDAVAAQCVCDIVSTLKPSTQGAAAKYLWIEPSAGKGAFIRSVPKKAEVIGIDIEPKAPGIIEADFLEWSPPTTTKKIISFGNPPFGKQSSLAKAFIKKCCTFSDIIAFILPLSFTKPSMSRAFDAKFHCILSKELQGDSFEINEGVAYDVPCVFQIWQKRKDARKAEKDVLPEHFAYVKSPDTDAHDVAFRRVGVYAGRCFKIVENTSTTTFSKQSHHFMVFDEIARPHVDAIVKNINEHTFPSNTVGPRSLSKSEINAVINSIIRVVIGTSEM